MAQTSVSLSLPAEVLAAIGRAALAAGVSPSAHVEDVLRRTYMPQASHPAAKLALLRSALEAARDWLDLQTRLRRLGYVLRIDGDAGLWLHSWPDDRPLMPCDELGHTLSGLVLRFRAPFPGATPDRSERRAAPRTTPLPHLARGRAFPSA